MNLFLFQVREIGVAIDPDAVHDVIDSLFRLGRNASDYSPLTPQQACSVQCIVWGNRKRSIDLTIIAEIRNIIFATGATLFLKNQQHHRISKEPSYLELCLPLAQSICTHYSSLSGWPDIFFGVTK